MRHDIISGKDNIVCEKKKFFFRFEWKKKKGGGGGGGSQILGWMYARGGGVIQMRTVCNRGGGGV